MRVVSGERRRQPRTRMERIQGVMIGCPSWQPRILPARLLDLSQGGLGVEMFVPLAVGSLVSVAGRLHGSDRCLAFEGQARVIDCRLLDHGLFRIGLCYEDVRYRSAPRFDDIGPVETACAEEQWPRWASGDLGGENDSLHIPVVPGGTCAPAGTIYPEMMLYPPLGCNNATTPAGASITSAP